MTVLTLKEAIGKGKLTFKSWLKSFSPERFEVVFSDIIQGRGATEYLNPKSFFDATFLTRTMEDVVKGCIARTYGQNNKGTFHLATGFGGGKSHLLGLLYHIFTSKKVPDPQILAELAKKEVPDVELISLDGHNLSFPIRNVPELQSFLGESFNPVVPPTFRILHKFQVGIDKVQRASHVPVNSILLSKSVQTCNSIIHKGIEVNVPVEEFEVVDSGGLVTHDVPVRTVWVIRGVSSSQVCMVLSSKRLWC